MDEVSDALAELRAVCGMPSPKSSKSSMEVHQSIIEYADGIRDRLVDLRVKCTRMAAMMRQTVAKVVAVVHRCINAARRVRCARRPVAKKAASSDSSDGDGPAGPHVNFYQPDRHPKFQQYLHHPTPRAAQAHVISSQGVAQ